MAGTTLRAYQVEACDAVDRLFGDGLTDVLGKAATGLGKTEIGLELVYRFLTRGKRVLWIAHRTELIDQPIERFLRNHPELELTGHVGKVMADVDEPGAQFVVGSVQTLSNVKRLLKVLAHGPIDFVIVDECHHAVAGTYLDTINALKAANPKLLHLGMTATPKRTDERGLAQAYQAVAFDFNIAWGIEAGWLVPFRAFSVETGISLKGVKQQAGDYAAGALAKVYDVDNAFELVAETHKKNAADRQGIAFTVSVAGAHLLAAKFNAAGIPAAACDGTTPKDVRKKVLDDFRAGTVRMICNCNVFTEGLDLPMASVLHMARPTKSSPLYVQMFGRGLRTAPGKTDLMVFDYIPRERDLLMAGDILGKPREQKLAEEKAAKEGVIVSAFSFTGRGNGIDGDPDELILRPLNLLAEQPHNWYFDDGTSSLDLGRGTDGVARTLVITKVHPRDGMHRLLLIARAPYEKDDRIFVLAKNADFEALCHQGRDFAAQHGTAMLTERGRSWQRERISPPQRQLLHQLFKELDAGYEEADLDDLSKGDASKVIAHMKAKIAIGKHVERLKLARGIGADVGRRVAV